jgi:hypothetical protein
MNDRSIQDADVRLPAGGVFGRGVGTRTILVSALFARLFTVWFALLNNPHDWLFQRGIEMGLLADSLLHGLGYSSPFGGTTGPTAFIAPGYPTLIAGIFFVLGSYTFASAIAIMVLQSLVGVATVALMMHVAYETLGPRTAKIAGWVWALSPPLLFLPTIFWETNFSACFLVGMVALALRADRRPTRGMWALLGACCAVVGLVNPALLPSLMGMLGWVAYRTWRRTRAMPVGLAVGLATLLVVFAPWPIRNALRFHAFIPLRSTVGFELWMGNRPGATGYLDESLFPIYNAGELASYAAKGEVAYTNDKSAAARQYMAGRPGIFIALTLRRIFRFWTGTGNVSGSPVYALHAGTTTMLGGVGLWLLFRRRVGALGCLMGIPLVLFPLPYYVTHAEFRYRIVVDPLMTILAAYAVARWAGRREDARVVDPV